MSTDPFAALGLPVRNDLTNEQVRAAWRQIAAATHPDRPDGGDVARYTAAASVPAIGDDVDEMQARPRAGAARLARVGRLLPDPHGPRAAAPAGPARDRRRHPVSRGHAAHRRPRHKTGRRHWNHHLVRTHPEGADLAPPSGTVRTELPVPDASLKRGGRVLKAILTRAGDCPYARSNRLQASAGQKR